MLGYHHPQPPGKEAPPSRRKHPPAIRSMNGRYTSYWNAFLFFFFVNLAKSYVGAPGWLAPPNSWRPPIREILDPPPVKESQNNWGFVSSLTSNPLVCFICSQARDRPLSFFTTDVLVFPKFSHLHLNAQKLGVKVPQKVTFE